MISADLAAVDLGVQRATKSPEPNSDASALVWTSCSRGSRTSGPSAEWNWWSSSRNSSSWRVLVAAIEAISARCSSVARRVAISTIAGSMTWRTSNSWVTSALRSSPVKLTSGRRSATTDRLPRRST